MVQSITLERFDTTTDIVAVMTVEEAQRAEYEIITTGTRLRGLLVEFYERRGWAALGFGSWRVWAAQRLGHEENMAYKELMAGRIEAVLYKSTNDAPAIGSIPESQLRPMAPLLKQNDPDLLRDTWQEAQDIATDRAERFTARHVEEAVKAVASPDVLPRIAAAPVIPMAVHFSSATPEHYTPAHIIALARTAMHGIDLDPASCAEANEIVQAAKWFGLDHPNDSMRDGMARAWNGRIWMNPPYGDEIGLWMNRLVYHYDREETTEAIALVPARTDTAWWHETTAGRTVCFIRGRLKFGNAENSAPFPSALVYFGEDAAQFIATFESIGQVR